MKRYPLNLAALTILMTQAAGAPAHTLERSSFTLSIACAAGADALKAGSDIDGTEQYLDMFNAMTYDYYGPWKMAGLSQIEINGSPFRRHSEKGIGHFRFDSVRH